MSATEMIHTTHQWNLFSSSGRESFSGSFVDNGRDEDGLDLILAKVSITGNFWPEPPFVSTVQRSGERLLEVFAVALPQVVLRRDRIELLLLEMAEWLHKPKEISIDLSSSRTIRNHLAIGFGTRRDLISSLDKPACTISYSANSFENGTWHFIVDQSCIRMFFEQVTEARDRLLRSA
jgi:hypothetical protein